MIRSTPQCVELEVEYVPRNRDRVQSNYLDTHLKREFKHEFARSHKSRNRTNRVKGFTHRRQKKVR